MSRAAFIRAERKRRNSKVVTVDQTRKLARLTFYEQFPSKAAAAQGLLAHAGPSLAEGGLNPQFRVGAAVIEVVAAGYANGRAEAEAMAEDGGAALSTFVSAITEEAIVDAA